MGRRRVTRLDRQKSLQEGLLTGRSREEVGGGRENKNATPEKKGGSGADAFNSADCITDFAVAHISAFPVPGLQINSGWPVRARVLSFTEWRRLRLHRVTLRFHLHSHPPRPPILPLFQYPQWETKLSRKFRKIASPSSLANLVAVLPHPPSLWSLHLNLLVHSFI